MPRKIYVPIWNTNIDEDNREAYLADLCAVGADTVFLAIDRNCLFDPEGCGETEQLKINIDFFRGKGFCVGVWFQGFGFGAPIERKYAEKASKYTKIRSVTGMDAFGDVFCPSDKGFLEDYSAMLRSIAKTSPDLMMIDDDMCMSVRPGIGCFCPEHIAMIEEEIGESLEGKDLPKLFFTGGKNKYRSAWLKIMDRTHSAFCRQARAAVDSVDQGIRLGFCSGFTSWDIEGADAIKLSKILAGKNKPFLRLTGAPYWAARTVNRFDGQQLASAIEAARIQEAWCRESGVEVFSEADSYPRPRYHVPSSLIECFDLAGAASGGMGVLKYIFDYRLPIEHERGYTRHHIHNRPLYEAIEKYFAGKETVGVRVYERMRKIEDYELPEGFIGQDAVMNTFFSPAAALLGLQSIPAKHTGEAECGIAFGENIRRLENMPRKMIIDLSAAEILMKTGVDVGIESVSPASAPSFEIYQGERAVNYKRCGRFARLGLKQGAAVVTELELAEGLIPGSFRYDNGETEFFVLAFDGYSVRQNNSMFTSYVRQKALLDFIGRTIHIENNPCVWTLVKRGGGETAILCLNIFEDPIFDGELLLDRGYSSAELVGARGVLEGEKIRLSEPIAPYGAFIAVLRD